MRLSIAGQCFRAVSFTLTPETTVPLFYEMLGTRVHRVLTIIVKQI